MAAMNCPHCQAAQPEPPSRFCDSCGLALPVARRPRVVGAAQGEEIPQVVCGQCGTPARAARCFVCGAPVHWPEGVTPPGSQEEGWARRRHARPVLASVPATAPPPAAPTPPGPTGPGAGRGSPAGGS